MLYGALRPKLIKNGYKPIPVIPADKRPAVKNWANSDFKPPAGYDKYSVGIVCGVGKYPVVAVDIDILNEDLALCLRDAILSKFGETIYRVGKYPKTLLLYRFNQAGAHKIHSLPIDCGRVEVLNFGQQFVSYGIHPGTKRPYDWSGILAGPVETKATDLPVLDPAAVTFIIDLYGREASGHSFTLKKDSTLSSANVDADFDQLDPLDRIDPLGKTEAEIKAMLETVSPDCNRDQWRNIGMGIHHETGGSDEGLELWDIWSAKSTKYKDGEPVKQWQSFGKYTGRPITIAYLMKLSKKESPEETENKTFFEKLPWKTDRFVDDPPRIELLIDNMLPVGIVALLFSAGGAGKSTVLLYLCIKIALALDNDIDFFGYNIHGGKTVIVTAEDPDIVINRRFVGIIKALSDELEISFEEIRTTLNNNFFIVSTFGKVAQLFKIKSDGVLAPTAAFKSLLACLLLIENLRIVVIDTKTRYSPGEGLGNVAATQEISYYEAIAQRTGATVLLSHHSNKASRNGLISGLQAYRDASAIYDSVRAAWYLRPLTPDEIVSQSLQEKDAKDYMIYENCKNNYIKMHNPIVLKRDGYIFTAQGLAPRLTKAERDSRSFELSLDALIDMLQNAEGSAWNKTDLKRLCRRADIGARRAEVAIEDAINDELIEAVTSDSAKGKAHKFALTAKGRAYKLEINEKDPLT